MGSPWYSDRTELGTAIELLRSIEFSPAAVGKCPVCLGWDKQAGEQHRTHTKTCALAALLKRHEGRFR